MREESVLLTAEEIEKFLLFLREQGRTERTIESYRHSLKELYDYLPESKNVDAGILRRWQQDLGAQGYAVRTINARTAAANRFLDYRKRQDLQIPLIFVEKTAIQPELTRAEYLRLLNAAKLMGQERTYFLLKTIGSTGVRTNELSQITIEHLKEGSFTVGKGNSLRTLRIPDVLREELLGYAGRAGITAGPVFITRNNAPLNRRHIHYSLKQLCRDARVAEEKVTPGCLRNLYRKTYEAIQQSISILTEQAYEKMLEEERLRAGWEVL